MLISFFKYLTFWTEYGGKGINIKKHRNNKQGDRKKGEIKKQNMFNKPVCHLIQHKR